MNTLENLFTVSNTATTFTISTAFLYAVCAGILGVIIALTYMKTGKVSTNFARTLVVLPILVCVVMMMVNGNLGTSIAIVGAFSLVRFRSLQGSSRDIAFIFFAMAMGLTSSMGYIGFALMITLLVCLVMILLQATHFAEGRIQAKELKVTIPENLDYSHIFDDLFEKYTNTAKLMRVKTTNMGSMYELRYQIEMKSEEQEKEFIDELRCRNGNLTIMLGRIQSPAEEL